MKPKRTKRELDNLAAAFEGRMAWLESAWGCRTEYEIDLSTGAAWFKVSMPGSDTALMVRCDVSGVTVPGHDHNP
jgi:hypothetical protein